MVERDWLGNTTGLRGNDTMDDTIALFIRTSVAAISAWLGTVLGGWDLMTKTLVIFMCADIVTGFLKALYGKSDKGSLRLSEIGKGIIRKVLSLFVVGVSVVLNDIIDPNTSSIRTMVIAWYIGCEGLSVFSNLSLLGVPFPAAITGILETLRQKGDKNIDTKK